MLIVALAFVLVPLLRPLNTDKVFISDEASNITIFRAQKQELDDDVARGLISAEERDTAVAELGARAVAEVPQYASAASVLAPSEKQSWIAAMCLAMLLPVVAILSYLALGSPQAISATNATKNAATAAPATGGPALDTLAAANAKAANGAEPPLSDQQILGMVASLAQKMDEQPNDPKGWILLARSQNALGRFPEAVQAYERAIKLLPNDAQLMADYADVLVAAQEGRFDGKPAEAISRALKIDPSNLKALALAGTAEMRLGNRAGSLKYWQKLKTLVAKDSDDYREVEAIIAEVSGKPSAAVANAAPVVSGAINANAAPNATPNATPNDGVSGGASVSGVIAIAPEVAAKVAAGDTLFVLARAAGGANAPRMPLAVLRVPAPQKWPYTFSLTDAMAMAPGMNLSSFPEVTIEARISKSGGATLQPGDLTGQISPVKPTKPTKSTTPGAPSAQNLAITISRVVP